VVQIHSGALILSILLGLAQRVANQVFGQNGFFAVGLVSRPSGLKIKTDRAIGFAIQLKLSQLTDFFACNHDFLLRAVIVG
jgi:hypothetical protein